MPVPVSSAPQLTSVRPNSAPKSTGRSRLVLLGTAIAAVGVAAGSLTLAPLQRSTSVRPLPNPTAALRPPSSPSSSSSPSPTTDVPATSGLTSMSVRGAAVISGSPSPPPGGQTTVYGVRSGVKVSVILRFSRGKTARQVLVGAELACRGRTDKWVLVGSYQDSLDVPAKAKGESPSATSWQSPWMGVPQQCRKGAESQEIDGYITGWSRSDASAQRSTVIAQIKLLS